MSQVKARVIRIVKGLAPEEPKTLVELKADEVVVQKPVVQVLESTVYEPMKLEFDAPLICKPEPSADASGFPNEVDSEGLVEGSSVLDDDATDASGDKKPVKPFVRFGMVHGSGSNIWPRSGAHFLEWYSHKLLFPVITR